MNPKRVFRSLALSVLLVSLQACSWAFVYDVSKTAPSSQKERNLRITKCSNDFNTIAPALDLTASLLMIPPLIYGGGLLTDKPDGFYSFHNMGAALIGISGPLATIFIMSMIEGYKRVERCEEFIKSEASK